MKDIEINIEANTDAKDEPAKETYVSEDVVFSDNNNEIELTGEINNARKKRRRSSASIE